MTAAQTRESIAASLRKTAEEFDDAARTEARNGFATLANLLRNKADALRLAERIALTTFVEAV